MKLLEITHSLPDPKIQPKFISIYKPIAGWKAVQYWWNPEMEGFWEPWQTAMFSWATSYGAFVDAKMWAECEELPLYISPGDRDDLIKQGVQF